MEATGVEYTTERIDHLGIVAGICKQINLVRIINESILIPTERKVSFGQAVQAMVLNTLGLTARALYLMCPLKDRALRVQRDQRLSVFASTVDRHQSCWWISTHGMP